MKCCSKFVKIGNLKSGVLTQADTPGDFHVMENNEIWITDIK